MTHPSRFKYTHTFRLRNIGHDRAGRLFDKLRAERVSHGSTTSGDVTCGIVFNQIAPGDGCRSESSSSGRRAHACHRHRRGDGRHPSPTIRASRLYSPDPPRPGPQRVAKSACRSWHPLSQCSTEDGRHIWRWWPLSVAHLTPTAGAAMEHRYRRAIDPADPA